MDPGNPLARGSDAGRRLPRPVLAGQQRGRRLCARGGVEGTYQPDEGMPLRARTPHLCQALLIQLTLLKQPGEEADPYRRL
ncbi:hypothetical protein NDU88_011637 [Pleurodeles waltl]|uniref:Uncharacterized protein n=1 Tax=Pleurodeles waltl TaxID=8319 RepID=A0AAV7Q187_PLEWA|nr:hypothetical protein NDU88_011637 [Pleurodeles waltl]